MSEAFEEALRFRASANGFVPMEVLQRLTDEEWTAIRMMSGAEATTTLRNLGPVSSRATTAEIDPDKLDRLRRL